MFAEQAVPARKHSLESLLYSPFQRAPLDESVRRRFSYGSNGCGGAGLRKRVEKRRQGKRVSPPTSGAVLESARRPASTSSGYMCGRLPYLLRPSNKPQTSSVGRDGTPLAWKGYSWEIPLRPTGHRMKPATYANFVPVEFRCGYARASVAIVFLPVVFARATIRAWERTIHGYGSRIHGKERTIDASK